MTRRPDEVSLVLRLQGEGLNAAEISRRTGIPRRTVVDWAAGRLPRSAQAGWIGCERCGASGHDFDGLPMAYAYLLGLYLGDGCIATHRRAVYKLRITLDAAYPGIVDECAEAMHAVLPSVRVMQLLRPSNDIEVYAYSRSWPCLFPQHGPGVKHMRPITLAIWQQAFADAHPELVLRGLIHSDGCRFMNTGTNWRHPRYSFSNRSPDIRRIFCDACDALGLRWTSAPHTVYVSRKVDVGLLDEFVGPKA